jgi:AcrR family transcriptional regulator
MPAPPKKPTLRRRYDDRQREVLDSCARVFAERGYHGTSIDDLIEATGLARGGLYHYIGSKSEALTRILDDLMGPLLDEAEAIVSGATAPDDDASGEPIERRLRTLVRVWVRRVASHRSHVRVFLQERTTIARDRAWVEIRGDRVAFETLLSRVLEQGVREGELTIDDPQLAALALLGIVNHTAVWFAPGGRLSADQVADGFVDLFLDGVRRGPGRPHPAA